MLEIERAMLNILCEAKEGIPAIITIKNTETGEVKKGQITLNGDKANMSKSISSQIYDKFKRAANKQAKTSGQQSQQKAPSKDNKKEQIAKIMSKLSPEEQKAFKLFYGEKLNG